MNRRKIYDAAAILASVACACLFACNLATGRIGWAILNGLSVTLFCFVLVHRRGASE